MTKQVLHFLHAVVCVSVLVSGITSQAQQGGFSESSSQFVSEELPDSPGSAMQAMAPSSSAKLPYPKYHRTIPSDRSALPLTVGDKLRLGLKNPLRPAALGSTLFSAAYSDVRNGAPHYGTDLPAFGERFGAAKLRQVSEAFFSYGVYASLFHEDPRYYVMGPDEKFTKRAVYSASRVVITRNDDGSSGVNWAKLSGLATAGALTNLYYPTRDQTVGRTLSGFVFSMAGTAGLNELHEFLPDVFRKFQHKRASN